jgi:hypothetical protein
VKHSEIRDRLSEYLERELPAAERAQIGAHLESCGDCDRELNELSATVSLLRGLPEPALPPGIGAAVMQRIAQGEGREARVHVLFRRIAEPRFAAALAAGVAGLFFLAGPGLDAAPTLPVAPGDEVAAFDTHGNFALEAFERSWRDSGDGSSDARVGLVSSVTPIDGYRQYVSRLRMEQAQRRARVQDTLRQLRGAGHPNSAMLASSHFESQPIVSLAGWQPR